MNIAIFPNFNKANAYDCSKEVIKVLHKENVNIFIDEKYRDFFEYDDKINFVIFKEIVSDMDFVIAIGGDGTILHCSEFIVGHNTKLLGINTGRLGFIASLEADELKNLKKLITGDYKIVPRMMLKAVINKEDKILTFNALNDIVISRLYSKICDFKVYVDDHLIGKYRADGVVFSTPTGSTAYSLSAGGPIIEPELECIEMNLICPHSLFSRTMLFSTEKKIKLVHKILEESTMYFSIDGNEPINLDIHDTIEIQKSEHKINIIDMTGSTFYDSLNKKMMKSIKGVLHEK